MRGFSKLPKDYFDKYSDKPVIITKYNPKSRVVANKYIGNLKTLLKDYKIDLMLRGSTAFEIAGKGEIEIGVYPTENDWGKIINELKKHFGKVDNLEKNYARFNDFYEGIEIEIILLKGNDAVVDKKLTNYLINSPDILKKYEKLKYKYSYSKRDYMKRKNEFLNRIVLHLH